MSEPTKAPDHLIQVRATSDERVLCTTCERELADKDIAMLLRKSKGGAFDPLCVWCTHRMVQAASFTMQIDEALESLSS